MPKLQYLLNTLSTLYVVCDQSVGEGHCCQTFVVHVHIQSRAITSTLHVLFDTTAACLQECNTISINIGVIKPVRVDASRETVDVILYRLNLFFD